MEKSTRNLVLIGVIGLILIVATVGGVWRVMSKNQFDAGLLAYQQGDVREAIEQFEDVAKMPEFMGAYVVEAKSLLAETELYAAADRLWRNRDYEEALSGFEEFLTAYPDSQLGDEAQDPMTGASPVEEQKVRKVRRFMRPILPQRPPARQRTRRRDAAKPSPPRSFEFTRPLQTPGEPRPRMGAP